MGKNFAYLVSEKFATSDNDENFLSEEFSNDLSEKIFGKEGHFMKKSTFKDRILAYYKLLCK